MLTVTPAALACSAKTCAARTTPAAISDVTSSTVSPSACPALRQQLLGLGDVLLALRDRRVEGRIEDTEDVVAEHALSAEHQLDHLLAVDDEPERLATSTLSNGATSTRITKGFQPPPSVTDAVIPPASSWAVEATDRW